MALKEEFKKRGDWLFRWRSYLPLFLLALFIVALKNFKYPYNDQKMDQLWEILCLTISFVGLGIRIYTTGHAPRGTSGGNTKGQVASVLNTSGMYSIVRHPLYLGIFFIWLGISLLIRLWWFSIIIILLFWIYYEKIMFAEEEFLREKFGESFTKWAEKTPAFFPKFKNWIKPDLSFSLKAAINREYSTFFAIIVTFSLLDVISEFFLNGRLVFDRMWIMIFSFGLMIYLIVRIIKKYTTLLKVEGR